MDPILDNSGAAAAAQPGAGAADAAATTATLLGTQAGEHAAAGDSLLGAQSAAAAVDPNTPSDAWLPEKFRVMEQDQLNFTASAQKLGEAYTALEKRFGAGEARPATADAYKIDQGAEFNVEGFLAAPGVKEWLGKAHELGFNDKQINFMIGEFVAAQPSQAEQVTGISAADAKAELQKAWATPEQFNKGMLAADAAARSLLKDGYQPFLARYGNDPVIIKLLATVGMEMSEDALRLAGTPMLTAETVEDLMRNPAYRDDKHPDHKRVTQQVREYFQRQENGNAVIM